MTPTESCNFSSIMAADSRVELQQYLRTNPSLKGFADVFGRTFLMGFIIEGKINLALEMIDQENDFEKTSKGSKRTVLHYAAILGDMRILEAIEKKGALQKLLHAQDNQGCTALHLAAKQKNVQVISYLLSNGARYYTQDKDGKTALYYTLAQDCLDSLKAFDKKSLKELSPEELLLTTRAEQCTPYLYEEYRDLNIKDKKGNSLLHKAVETSSIESIRALLNRNVTINVKNQDGESPLSLACILGNDAVATILLEAGADANCGRTAPLAQIYFRDGVTSLTKLLVTKSADPYTKVNGSTLLQLADKLHDHEFKTLLEQNLASKRLRPDDTAQADSKSFNSIIIAARQANLCQFEQLLQNRKTNVVETDYAGNNALHVSVMSSNQTVTCFLIANFGAMFVNGQNKALKTPVHVACEKGDFIALKRLLPFWDKMKAIDERGNTLFHSLAKAEEVKKEIFICIIDLLHSYKLDINALNKEMKSPLHLAAECGNSSLFYALLEKGANPNASKDLHNDLFGLLLRKKQFEEARLLVQSGLQRHAKYGTTTPLILACQEAPASIVFDLLDPSITPSKPADPNFVRTNKSPLMESLKRYIEKKDSESESIFIHLLRSKVDPDKSIRQEKKRKITALVYACYAGSVDAVNYLLQYKAKADKRPKGDHSPLSIACQKGYVEIAQNLLNHGAKITSEMNKKRNWYSQEIQELLSEKKSNSKKSGLQSVLIFGKTKEAALEKESYRRVNRSLLCNVTTQDDDSPQESEMSASCSNASSECNSGFQTPFEKDTTSSDPVDPDMLQKRLQQLTMQ